MVCTFQGDHSLNQNSPPTHETKTLLKSIRREQILCWDFKDCGRRNESIWILAGSDTPDQPAHGGSTHANRTSASYTETNSRHTWHHISMLTVPVTSSRHCCTRMVILRLLRRPHRPGSRPENFLCLMALKVSGVSEALTCQTPNISSYQQLCQSLINSESKTEKGHLLQSQVTIYWSQNTCSPSVHLTYLMLRRLRGEAGQVTVESVQRRDEQ